VALKPKVVVVGLGPGDPKLASAAALEALRRVRVRFLRTERHPSAHLVGEAESFDRLYESSSSHEQLYSAMVAELARAASVHGEVLYAVPGSPLVAERSVELLLARADLEVELALSMSFLDLAWERLGVDPLARSVRLVDGWEFEVEAAGERGPFLVAQCDSQRVLSALKLCVDQGPVVTVLQRLGTPQEQTFEIPWEELDRAVEPDHLTSVWVPRLASPVAAELSRLVGLVRTLRQRCPWDRAQTHKSLARHLVEETYEVIEAIDELADEAPGSWAHLEEELGDLLFQVLFHSNLAAEEGEFDLSDVARSLHDKLVERHPHVFADPGSPPPDWEQTKRQAKGRTSALEGVPRALPALPLAYKLSARAASAGFDWPDAEGVWATLGEELRELERAWRVLAGPGPLRDDQQGKDSVAEELGDVLFTLVNLARHLGLDPEEALRSSGAKFARRFSAMEELARERGQALDEQLWQEAKRKTLPASKERLPSGEHQSQE